MDPRALDAVVRRLDGARRLLFITGAGISADSGLPTYRGVGGLYDSADPDGGLTIEGILSGPTLRRDPALCWRHIAQIEARCRGALPNLAHRVVARLQDRYQVTVLTQNVDGLHTRAGSDPVIEIHGRIHRLRCTAACGWHDEVEDYSSLTVPPICPDCGAIVRPDVVLFGEALPQQAVGDLRRTLRRSFDVVFSVGTTSAFPYISGPVVDQVREGGLAVEINPGRTAVSSVVTHRLAAGAAEALGALWRRLEGG